MTTTEPLFELDSRGRMVIDPRRGDPGTWLPKKLIAWTAPAALLGAATFFVGANLPGSAARDPLRVIGQGLTLLSAPFLLLGLGLLALLGGRFARRLELDRSADRARTSRHWFSLTWGRSEAPLSAFGAISIEEVEETSSESGVNAPAPTRWFEVYLGARGGRRLLVASLREPGAAQALAREVAEYAGLPLQT
jgi:hypothetical protein